MILALVPLLTGCASIKATVPMAQLEQAMLDAEAARAQDNAIYEYTLAEQYRLKSHEEWGHSDYGAAEQLARTALQHAADAEKMALYGSTDEDAQRVHDTLEALDEGVDIVPDIREEVIEDEWIELDDIDLDDL